MRGRAAALLVTAATMAGLVSWPAMVQDAAAAADCAVKPGGPEPQGATPWAQTRLGFQQQAWQISQGDHVTVAVIDSGLDVRQPQIAKIRTKPGVNVIPGFAVGDTTDCYGHGTAVAGIIAAPKVTGTAFVGVAPLATILPIKQTNTQDDKSGTAAGLAQGIEDAIVRDAKVINISVTVVVDSPRLKAAVADAARHDIVIVAAAGNDGTSSNLPAYPAAYSPQFPNILAVSATDQNDQVAAFSDSGSYVSVGAPGAAVEVPLPGAGFKLDASGTSFAAPFVSGTAALVRSAFPKLTAVQVCARIKATADPPGIAVPNRLYGYGVVNPNLALTAIRDDAAPAPVVVKPSPLPAPRAAAPADRHLQHLATAIGLILLGLTVLAALGASVIRRSAASSASHRRRTAA